MKKPVSFKEAARIVLQSSDQPMSAKEITSIALKGGLLETEGQTPEATMAAQLYVDIKRNRRTSFRKVGKGLFTLKKKAGSIESPVLLLDEQNRRVRKDLGERLFAVDPFQFEFLIADLLQKIGFENIEVTARSGDKGIDIVANLTVGGVTNVKTVVQV
ncbi:MAG: HTH domain-containing protein, partial [Holophagales bacterium]|nr:HTH domain-containing protein [Holophagales bacterium]